MNGRPRDSTLGDIVSGRQTLSVETDALALNVSRLLTYNEQEEFGQELDRWCAASTHWNEWMDDPRLYLGDLDPDVVASITESLRARLDALRQRAVERGWEAPE